MRILFFTLGVSLCTFAHSWNVTQTLKGRCLQPAPEWMQKRIEKDLQAFSEVSRTTIDQTLDLISQEKDGALTQLVNIQCEDGNVRYSSPFSLTESSMERLHSFIAALETLHQIMPLPNLDLIVSLASHYDRPYFSPLTKAPVFTVCKERGFMKAPLFPRGLWESNRELVFKAVLEASENISWESRQQIGFWRGSSSEPYHRLHWDQGMRPRLVFFSRAHPEYVDARLIDNDYFNTFDFGWVHWIRSEGFTKPFVAPEEQLHHRYLIAIEGDGTATSLAWQLFSGSTVCIADGFSVEWFYDALQPYVHYLPLRRNSTDIEEKINYLREHDGEAAEIARHAREFAQEWLSDESVFFYFYKLLHAYAAKFSTSEV